MATFVVGDHLGRVRRPCPSVRVLRLEMGITSLLAQESPKALPICEGIETLHSREVLYGLACCPKALPICEGIETGNPS